MTFEAFLFCLILFYSVLPCLVLSNEQIVKIVIKGKEDEMRKCIRL